MKSYVYQAAQLDEDGTVRDICHERKFDAFDDEAATITADALHEVLKVAEHCNAIRVLDVRRRVLWTRMIKTGVVACS